MSPIPILCFYVYEYIFYSIVTTNFRSLILDVIIGFYNNIYQISIGRHIIMSYDLKKRSRPREEDYIGNAFSITTITHQSYLIVSKHVLLR